MKLGEKFQILYSIMYLISSNLEGLEEGICNKHNRIRKKAVPFHSFFFFLLAFPLAKHTLKAKLHSALESTKISKILKGGDRIV